MSSLFAALLPPLLHLTQPIPLDPHTNTPHIISLDKDFLERKKNIQTNRTRYSRTAPSVSRRLR